jgi:hypothetical protein
MSAQTESQRTVHSASPEAPARVAPRTVWENRNISARLHGQQLLDCAGGRTLRQATVDLGTVPVAFDPEELAETVNQTSAAQRETKKATPPPVAVHLAVNAWEHLQAFNLVHEQYVAFGYMAANENRVRITPWNLNPSAHTFIALRDGRVVGTLTCIEDGPQGLPAEELYPTEIQTLRTQRNKLLEVSALAISSQETDTTVVMEMIRHLITLSRSVLGGSDWVITVNPRHVRFYRKVMLFELLGEEKSCVKVNGAPAVLLRMDLTSMPEKYAERYGRRCGTRNLHEYFFAAEKERERLAKLRDYGELRNAQERHTRRILELLGGLTPRPANN